MGSENSKKRLSKNTLKIVSIIMWPFKVVAIAISGIFAIPVFIGFVIISACILSVMMMVDFQEQQIEELDDGQDEDIHE